MFRQFQRRPLAALALAFLTLSACHKAPAPAAPASHAAAAAPAPRTGIAISNPRLVLPAVAGNPGAAYFDLENDTDGPVTLTRVEVEGVKKTEMHETSGTSMAPLSQVTVPPGGQVSFAPGGKHVMVFGAPPPTAVGKIGEMTLEFEGGRREKAAAMVQAAGGASAMPGMDHGAMH